MIASPQRIYKNKINSDWIFRIKRILYFLLDDESDFIQFNSTEEGRILFNGTIGQIQVNGNIVNRENILMELDNVFNSAATGFIGLYASKDAINNKGNVVAIPTGFDKINRMSQEHFLASLREVLEPRCHKRADGFNVEARAHLK